MQDLDLASLEQGGKAALARTLARIERRPDSPEAAALLDAAWKAPRGVIWGITGPPGVGKSTLAGALIRRLRERGLRVAVIAVDPSSKRSGGALLGDRIRLLANPQDPDLFVRSMAARDRLGGLAALTWSAAILMRSLFDRVIVETVGVGQSETDVAGLADTVLFCVQPGSGDSLQFMKAGIMEIPHVAAVTKADSGTAARRALKDLRAAVSLAEAEEGWEVCCLSCSAASGAGLDNLEEALDSHAAWARSKGLLDVKRRQQAEEWVAACLRDDYGSLGCARLADEEAAHEEGPFSRRNSLRSRIEGSFS